MPDTDPRKYGKPALPASQLMQFLVAKGLHIDDMAFAEECLNKIGYYRLKIYSRFFESDAKRFEPGTTFSDVLKCYDLDRDLRMLANDAIERVEVAVRSVLCETLCAEGGPHFFLEKEVYFQPSKPKKGFDPAVFFRAVQRKAANDPIIQHYTRTYTTPDIAPFWCLCEVFTFGDISKIYSALKLNYRKRIAKEFDLDEKVLVSWMKTITTFRNACAHHKKIFNTRFLVNQPIRAQRVKHLMSDDLLFSRLILLYEIMKSSQAFSRSAWFAKLCDIIQNRPRFISLSDMGFPDGWAEDDFWATGSENP